MVFDLIGKAVKNLRLPTVTYDNQPIRVIPAQMGDVNSRYISITLYDDRGDIDLSVYKSAIFNATLPSGTVVVGRDCSIDTKNNCIVCKINGNMLQEAGRISCDISVIGDDGTVQGNGNVEVVNETTEDGANNEGGTETDGDGSVSTEDSGIMVLTSQTFYILATKSQSNDESIEGDENYSVLIQLINSVDEGIGKMNAATNEFESLKETIENQVDALESLKTEVEVLKADANNTLQELADGEETRNQNVQDKISELQTLEDEIKNDINTLEGLKTDVLNLENEVNVKLTELTGGEETRNQSVNEKISEMDTAINAVGNLEDTIEQKMTEYDNSEKERQAFELARQENENERITNENNRQSFYTEASNAENERITAEEQRKINESNRENAESERNETVAQKIEELSIAFGHCGTLTIAASDWVDNSYSVALPNVSSLDFVIFYPQTDTDSNYVAYHYIRTAQDTPDGVVTFTCVSTPTVDINFRYYVDRGEQV